MAYKLPSLYAFSLPRDLISQLEPRKLVIPLDHPLHPSNQQQSTLPEAANAPLDVVPTKEGGGAYKCALTGASFSDLQGLKEHYRTDWYKYNVKLKLQGKKTPVGEEEFNSMVDSKFPPFPQIQLCHSILTPSSVRRFIRFHLWIRIDFYSLGFSRRTR